MAVNMFEGARRIALAIGAAWTLGCVAYAVLQKPYAPLFFSVESPGSEPKPVEQCGTDDAREYISREFEPGTPISVTLCFAAHRADNGRMLIPYARVTSVELPDGRILQNVPLNITQAELLAKLKANGIDISRLAGTSGPSWEPLWRTHWNMGEPYSTEVSVYTQRVADGFSLTRQSQETAASQLWQARLRHWKESFQVLVVGLLLGWALTALIGWIARGFLGIPRGKDHRPA